MKSDREKEANAWPSWRVWRTARRLRDGAGEWNEWRKDGLEMRRTEAVESNSTWCAREKKCEMCERDERWRRLTACGTGHATRKKGSVFAVRAAKLAIARSNRSGINLLGDGLIVWTV